MPRHTHLRRFIIALQFTINKAPKLSVGLLWVRCPLADFISTGQDAFEQTIVAWATTRSHAGWQLANVAHHLGELRRAG